MARLEFSGARYVRNYHLAVPHHELDLDKKKSFPSPGTPGEGSGERGLNDNLIIHGDNLKALKALLPHYAGKVKCIYIDPPYNTGNENWAYNDNVNSPRHKEWLGKVVDKDCTDRHDRWLSMMTPRLKLLRELLRDDGVIFISIDDNEVAHLRMLMDEIFGEENFIADFIWNHRKSSQNDINVSLSHNYTIAYSKTIGTELNTLDAITERFSNPDNDPKGDWVADPMDAPGVRENLQYKIKNPNTKEVYMPPPGRHWRFTEEKYNIALKENRIVFGKTGNSKPQYKRYKDEAIESGRTVSTIWNDIETATDATRMIMEIFGGEKAFDTPKPVELLKRIIKLSANDSDIILDSFAGSGTTAHAVLALNKEDGGNRKFILIEQEDYADTITAERVRRVIKGVKGAKKTLSPNPSPGVPGEGGLGGSFTYVTLGAEYDAAKFLAGKNLPKYEDMAAYVFQTATGEPLDRKKIDKKKNFIGSSKFYDVYLLYEPDVKKLKSAECALKLDFVESLPKKGKKKRLVFGAVRYVNQDTLNENDVEFCQLPYEVYRRLEDVA